jgi:N-ethylmaleimide reductase
MVLMASSHVADPSSPTLLSPAALGPLTLRNRMVMAPMTRNRAGAGNAPTALNATYYAQRASAGLIVTEGTQVSPQGLGYLDTPGIHSDPQVEGWRHVTDAVHARGGRIFAQLWHVGRISHPELQPDGALPVAPSAIAPEGFAYTASGQPPFETPRALETSEIPGVVRQFGDAAQRAREAGFDGVEIHGAYGYLIDQFLRDGTNHRTDAYGGTIEKRTRFLLEVTEAVANVWGADRVGVRLSPTTGYEGVGDTDPLAHFAYAAHALSALRPAYMHVVAPEVMDPASLDRAVAVEMRQRFDGCVMLNGGFDHERAEHVVASGLADLVSFGHLFLANPDLPERLSERAPLNTPDRDTFYGGDARGYTDYPTR